MNPATTKIEQASSTCRHSGEVISKLTSTRATPSRIDLRISDGQIALGSDLHASPNEPASTAWRAFVHLTKLLQPQAVVLNGDVCDFPSISKHPRADWSDRRPTVKEEIACAQARLREIQHQLHSKLSYTGPAEIIAAGWRACLPPAPPSLRVYLVPGSPTTSMSAGSTVSRCGLTRTCGLNTSSAEGPLQPPRTPGKRDAR